MKCGECRKEIDDKDVREDVAYLEEKGYDQEKLGDTTICQTCAREHRIADQTEAFKKGLEAFMRTVNSTAFNSENITAEALVRAFTKEHRYLQNELLIFFYKVFDLIGKLPDGYIDGRNEWGYEWVRTAVKALENN